MGSVWRRLGTEVTVVEFLNTITPSIDKEISANFMKICKKQGMKFKLSTKVTGTEVTPTGVKLTVEPSAGGEPSIIEADVVLVSTGRRPFTKNLGLEELGIEVDKAGRIVVAGYVSDDGIAFRGVLIRMLADGAPDAAFGTNGVAQLSAPGQGAHFEALALQADGKIVVAGAFTRTMYNDAVHVVAATLSRQDVLVSWNFKHLVNRRRRAMVCGVNATAGLPPIDILSPPEL